jgi:dihydroorotate dehydrogenase (fumarate)
MINLNTTYLGLKLRTPLVASASPLSHKIAGIRSLEDAGASAIVLFSLFEEQVRGYATETNRHIAKSKRFSCFPKEAEFYMGPAGYLHHIRLAKEAVRIPIIASLNCCNVGTWTEYAKQVQMAGADAVECNICPMATDPAEPGSAVEQKYLDILRAIKQEVKIPVAIKLSPFFTNLAYMARRLDECGADGLVLFNRFYQPDIDLDQLKLDPSILLSTAHDLRLPLTWVGLLFGRVRASLAATGGIHTSDDVIKLLLAGANVTMLCSVLLERGVAQIHNIEEGLRRWLVHHEFKSIGQILGSLNELRSQEPGALERAQYMRAIKDVEHVRARVETHLPVE